ncbi:MAG: hypothetical protein GX777_05925 [Fastidiosipila sp.]|nr:hypothetical protein [Fastidiosipila sp.]
MDNLHKYIDTVFQNYPDSPTKDALKDEAEAKYRARIDEGLSEAEALGSVIQELDLESTRQKLENEAAPIFGRPDVPEEEKRKMAAGFRKFQPRFAVGIGLGVVLAIAGIVLSAVAGIYFNNPALTVIAFFVPIAVAVFLFIVLGMRYSSYMSFFRANRMYEYLSADEANRMLRLEYRYKMHPGEDGYKKERRREAASSVLWLITVIAFLLLGFLGDLWHPGWIVFLVAAAIQTLISLL